MYMQISLFTAWHGEGWGVSVGEVSNFHGPRSLFEVSRDYWGNTYVELLWGLIRFGERD